MISIYIVLLLLIIKQNLIQATLQVNSLNNSFCRHTYRMATKRKTVQTMEMVEHLLKFIGQVEGGEFKDQLDSPVIIINQKKDQIKRGWASFKILWSMQYPGLDYNKKRFAKKYLKLTIFLLWLVNFDISVINLFLDSNVQMNKSNCRRFLSSLMIPPSHNQPSHKPSTQKITFSGITIIRRQHICSYTPNQFLLIYPISLLLLQFQLTLPS